MKSKDKRTCPICGTLFDSDSESCPVCALQNALQPEARAFEIPPTDSDLRFEHYRVLKKEDGTPIELGRGAMGVTYKAFDILLHRPVALKIINARLIGDASARNRFVREARAAASVRHPNVASVFHLGEAGGDYFYAMAFVDGETLQNLIEHTGRLNTALALEIATQAAAGLAAIHKQHLIHRDIKPSNIMISIKEGQLENVEIIDLGLAKGVAEEGSLSASGAFVGTPGYASPEQFAGVGVDIRSDLYSLGITLWKMLSGSPPFKGKTSELVYQHQHVPPPFGRLVGVPKQVVPLLEILLEKDPARRFQTPNDLLKAMTVVIDALNSGRRLTKDELRSRVAKIVLQKRSGTLLRDLPARTGKGVRTLGWLGLSLAVVALLFGLFLFSRRPEPSFHSPQNATRLMEKGVAVLPFESLSPNKDDSYFADGVQDEILNNVAKIAQLKVISRTSVMQYRAETKRDLRQIAYTLGVAHILEGTVRRNGNRVRVSTELVDARDDQTIWADSYDRDLTDIFAIQSEVAQTIAAKLAATLSPAEKKIIEARPTDNLEAYDLYLRAKELIFGAELSSAAAIVKQPLLDAAGFLEKAVGLDPNFALAYCASANAHDLLYFWYDQTAERLALADAAIRAASRLQPGLPEVHLADARHLYRGYRNYDAARAQLGIAKRGLPNNVEVVFLEALMDRRQGDMERAIQRLNEVVARDPRNPASLYELAVSLFDARRIQEAGQIVDRVIELRPDRPMLRVEKAILTRFMPAGDSSAVWSAIATLPRSMTSDPEVLSVRLWFALVDRDWTQAKQLIEKMNGGEDNGNFGYATRSVPIGCYSILLARLRKEQPSINPAFAETRKQLNLKVQRAPQDAALLSELAVVDALLDSKETAISEAKRAADMLPVSQDAVDGAAILKNLAVVHAWTGELELAFDTLRPITKTPLGIYYGELKRDPYWEPIRQDLRYEKLLAELAPKD